MTLALMGPAANILLANSKKLDEDFTQGQFLLTLCINLSLVNYFCVLLDIPLIA